MKTQQLLIAHVPTILWGNDSTKLYLYVHGQGGNKEEAAFLAEKVCAKGWQVLSFDLPGHGARAAQGCPLDPWHVVPELNSIMRYAKDHWSQMALYASSIGAWFSMLCFQNESFQKCLFVSPVLDMKQLILKMMGWANVTAEQLRCQKMIPTSFGQTLSWEYWQYAVEHPISKWESPTQILYGENDNMVDYSTVESFSQKFHCTVTVMERGEHWFHTEQQMEFLGSWISNNVPDKMEPALEP